MSRAAERAATSVPPLAVRALRRVGAALLALPAGARWIPAAGWMGLIFVLSSQSLGGGGSSGPCWGLLTNLAHPFEFGVLALFLALLAPREQGWPRLGGRASGWIVAACGVYALGDEWHQAFEPARNASLADLASDVLGAWLAVRAAALVAGPGYDARRLARLVLRGLAACLACAAAANWLPQWFPDAAWL